MNGHGAPKCEETRSIMNSAWLVALLGIVLSGTWSKGFSQQPSDAHSTRSDPRANARASTGQFVAATTAIFIPSPINERQLEHLAHILELSSAQLLQFRTMYQNYLADDQAFRAEKIQPLWDRSADITALNVNGRPPTVEFAEQFAELMKDRQAAVALLWQMEDRFLSRIETYLAEEQVQFLPRAKSLRVRQRCRVTPSQFPGSKFDLSEILFEIIKTEELQLERPDQYKSLQIKYEASATPLFQTAMDCKLRCTIEGTLLQAYVGDIGNLPIEMEKRSEKARPLRIEHNDLRNELATAEKAIYDLNREYVELLADELPNDAGEEFRKWFRESTYRIIYPNPFDLERVFHDAMSIETLSADQAALLDVVRSEFMSRRDELSISMEKEYLQWRFYVISNSGYEFAVYRDYQPRMLRMQQQRRENAEAALATLAGVLDTEQLALLSPAIGKYHERSDQFDQLRKKVAQSGRSWPPATDRPYK